MLGAVAEARVTRIVIDETLPLAADASGGVAFEQIAGRAFGELDPNAPGNALIQDIQLGKDADGKVRYVATFVLTKPVDVRRASGLLWHEVPNRGNRRPNVVQPTVRYRNVEDLKAKIDRTVIPEAEETLKSIRPG